MSAESGGSADTDEQRTTDGPSAASNGATTRQPAAAASSLRAQSGETDPQLEIGDALRLSSPLPVLTIDPPGSGPLRWIAGALVTDQAGLRVEIALRRGTPRKGCAWWVSDRARFTRANRAACDSPRWQRAALRRTRGGWRWRAKLGGSVPGGGHALLVRVSDRDGRPVDVQRG